MNLLRKTLHDLIVQLADEAAEQPRDIPLYRFDGEEVKSAHDVAAVLGISVIEAQARLDHMSNRHKDVHGGISPQALSVGVGTKVRREKLVERIGALRAAQRKKRRRRKA
jgi:hypothetical protein